MYPAETVVLGFPKDNEDEGETPLSPENEEEE